MPNLRVIIGFSVVVLFAFLLAACTPGENYGKLLDSRWRNIFGLDPRDGEYRWFGYPVDNFGVATFYDPPANRDWTDSDRICATWSCLELDPNSLPNDSSQKSRIAIGGYADVGAGGGITLDETAKSHVAVNLLLPGLAKLVNLTAGVDWSKGIKTVVSMGKAYRRSIRRDDVAEFIKKNSHNETLKTDFANGRLAYIAADIVAEDFDVTLTVDKKLNANADAKLTQVAATVFPKDSDLKVTVDPNTTGTYHITVKGPVVLAVQTRRQPGGSTLGASDNPGATVARTLPPPHF